MLAVVSDLHLTDCTTATNPHASAFELLTGELTINAKSKRASEIQVLLLGDIVDLVRTSYWHEKAIPADRRPWGGKLDPATAMNPDPDVERQFLEVLERVLAQASTRALLDGLKELRDRDGRPPKIAYVVGNHDRVLHNFPSLRARIARELAPLEVEFSTFFHSEVYSVAARHGHEWEVTCHGWEFLRKVLDRKSRAGRFDPEAYRVMAIGEAITAELMSGFVHHLQTTLTAPADAPFLRMAGEVNNLRPQTDVIRWITWRLAKAESGRYLQAATEAFRTALEATLGCTLAKRWDELKRDFVVSGDITDHLSKALGLLKGKNGLKRLETLIPILEKAETALAAIRGPREDALRLGAAEEFEKGTVPPGTQYLLYGHSHSARHDCLRARRDGTADIYLNTGTFLPLIERAADRASFSGSNRMSYLCFYNSEEDVNDRVGNGPTVEVWDGIKRKEYAENR